ncbi:hypothetical protein Golax_011648 [Gossypium laxum]|uniref:RNase H type-1 domain-containing protein n=1 Tax=Gossypium laxum TaxID=34288 RepID=A0A7J8ZL46_9ROSI|nr:hypothetical protein [Gossypium laxum]
MGEILKNVYESNSYVWKLPINDTIKINFDTPFNQHSRRLFSGIIPRNKEGLVMASCTYSWENILDPVMAEARACLQAVTTAEEMGFQDLCVEGDALTIIRKLNSAEEYKSRETTMMVDRWKSLSPDFVMISLSDELVVFTEIEA